MQLVGAASDDIGQVHLIAQKKAGDIYYAQNYLANANNASFWTPLIFIAGESEPARPGVENIAAIAAKGDEIVVIYSGTQDGNGLYFTSSSDNGNSWTDSLSDLPDW